MSEKVYLNCQAKARQTQYGEVLNIGIKADALIAFAQQHANSRGYVNLTVQKRRETGKFGETHSVTLDTYEPKGRAGSASDEESPF